MRASVSNSNCPGIEQLEELTMELQLSDNGGRYSPQPSHQQRGSSNINQSILGVMKNFIEAVNDMDETVLIPSRLMDMQPDVTTTKDSTKPTTATSEESKNSVVSSTQPPPNLHAYYTMLKAVKTELVRGPSQSDDDEDNLSEDLDNASDSGTEELVTEGAPESPDQKQLSQATARAFREHLNGLFNVLEQLTGMTQSLTSKYQTELGDHQSCIRPKAFSM